MSHFARNYARILTPVATVLALAILLTIASSPVFADSSIAAGSSVATESQGTVLVHFNEGTDIEARTALIAEMGGELVTWIPQLNVAEIRVVGGDQASVAALPADASGIVSYAEANL